MPDLRLPSCLMTPAFCSMDKVCYLELTLNSNIKFLCLLKYCSRTTLVFSKPNPSVPELFVGVPEPVPELFIVLSELNSFF